MDRREAVEFVGVQAALVAAGLHLVWGVPRAIVYLQAGQFTDPRPFLFVASSLAVVLAVTRLYYADLEGRSRRRTYGFLLGLLVVYLVGYALWHVGGHPTFRPGSGPLVHYHYHPTDPVSNVLGHLAGDAFALVNAAVEVVGIAAFGWLLARE